MTKYLSSLQGQPFRDFLPSRLQGALAYKRIAGYFSSSILEIAGEAIESMAGKVQVIANTEIIQMDLEASRGDALRGEFFAEHGALPSSPQVRERLKRFCELIVSGKLEVRLVGSDKFGLIHGKGGVITKSDGSKTAFVGSANETRRGWAQNYEIVWEDESNDAVEWMEREFETLHRYSRPLPDWVVKEAKRMGESIVLTVDDWEDAGAEPDSALTSTPLYRQEGGLRPYQEWYVDWMYRRYLENPKDARGVLADEVGVGKTIQLALVAALITLRSKKPCLILCPKTLTEQWQVEISDKLMIPSARWSGRDWITETGERVSSPLVKCPRKIGIISQGLVTQSAQSARELLRLNFGCVIVDEAHRAREYNSGPNNLMKFLREVSERTDAFLLGTATPVQLDPAEAYRLLDVLNRGYAGVLGTQYSRWNQNPEHGLAVVRRDLRPSGKDEWEWLRHPLPTATDAEVFGTIRDILGLPPSGIMAQAEDWEEVGTRAEALLAEYNPYLNRITQRSRQVLEDKGLLPVIQVYTSDKLIELSTPLQEAFQKVEEFCRSVGKMINGTGFIETMLARRIGSSISAGLKTVERLLQYPSPTESDDDEDDDSEDTPAKESNLASKLDGSQRKILEEIRQLLMSRADQDEKGDYCRARIMESKSEGILLFSQYLDTIESFAFQDWGEPVAIYAGGGRSKVWHNGKSEPTKRETIKEMVRRGEIRVLFGTDAAAEGLNLQTLRHLVNIDCPWNPTKMEQRLGRIRRIGQLHSSVTVTNLRYAGSVEDRVHQRLSERGQAIRDLLGTYPESFGDVWIEEARGNAERVKTLISRPLPDCGFLRRAEHTFQESKWGFSPRMLDPAEVTKELSERW